MLFAHLQDQLACITAKAAMWSCVSGASEGRTYRLVGPSSETTAASRKQFAHRGSVSSLFVRIPARLGNPEDSH